MTKLLSRLTTPAVLLYIFIVVTQFAYGIYVARNAAPPPAFTLLYPFCFLWVIGWWLMRDSRVHNVKWVFDMGLFLYIAWPFIMPYYLFKTRGARGFVTILIFGAAYLGAYVAGVALYILLVP
jgi:hypothetical protein